MALWTPTRLNRCSRFLPLFIAGALLFALPGQILAKKSSPDYENYEKKNKKGEAEAALEKAKAKLAEAKEKLASLKEKLKALLNPSSVDNSSNSQEIEKLKHAVGSAESSVSEISSQVTTLTKQAGSAGNHDGDNSKKTKSDPSQGDSHKKDDKESDGDKKSVTRTIGTFDSSDNYSRSGTKGPNGDYGDESGYSASKDRQFEATEEDLKSYGERGVKSGSHERKGHPGGYSDGNGDKGKGNREDSAAGGDEKLLEKAREFKQKLEERLQKLVLKRKENKGKSDPHKKEREDYDVKGASSQFRGNVD